MKFTLPVFVLAALSLADKQGDYDAIASAVKPFVKQAKCGLPCVIGALGKARSRKAGEPVTETLCNKGNRRKVTSEADMCLGRNCHLSGIAPIINIGLGFACKHPELLSGKGYFRKRQEDECAQCQQDCEDSACQKDDNGGEPSFGCALCVGFCETVCAIDQEEPPTQDDA